MEQATIKQQKEWMSEMTNGILGEQECYWLEYRGYFTAPAAKKYHGSHEGGLFEHSMQVAHELMILTDKLGLKWERPESPAIIGLVHDICKMDDYIIDEEGKIEWNNDKALGGHGDKSVIMAQQFMHLTMEEVMCIRYHMGPYEGKEMWQQYGEAIKRYPNIMWTHQADMIASHIKGL